MFNTLTSHAEICSDVCEKIQQPHVRFDIGALAPFDAMKVVLEQAIYARYLLATSGLTRTVKELIDNSVYMLSLLPKNTIPVTHALHSVYDLGIDCIKFVLRDITNGIECPGVSYQDFYLIFNQPDTQKYPNFIYTCSMTEVFLTEFLSFVFGYFDSERYPEKELLECAMYIPSAEVKQNYDPNVNSSLNDDYGVVIALTPRAMTSFDLVRNGNCNLANFFKSFNMSNYSVDDIVVLIAAFDIDHDQYVMTNYRNTPVLRMASIAYDMVRSSKRHHKSGNGAVDFDDFMRMFIEQVKNGRLKTVQEYGLFGELLQYAGIEQPIVEYFMKPVDKITAMEAFAFRNSLYANLVQDRFISGMEALDETGAETDEVSGDTEGMNEPDSNSSTDDIVTDGNTEDQSLDNKSADDKPLDPKMMLFEVMNKSGTMSEYIYRELIARRISNILKNPPENVMPNDLILMKRWRSRWLYLASHSSLKDFLSKLSIRLSDG